MRIKRKTIVPICLLTLLCASLPGCGRGEASLDSSASPEEPPSFDLLTEEWKGYEHLEERTPQWTVTGFLEDIGYEPESISGIPGAEVWRLYWHSDTDRDTFYCLEDYCAPDDVNIWYEYYLTEVDTVSLKASTVKLKFSKEILEAAGILDLSAGIPSDKAPHVTGLEVTDGKPCVFFQQFDENRTDTIHYYALWFDEEGNMQEAVDLLPAMQREGGFHSGTILLGSACFGDGHFYIYKGAEGVLVLDETGAFVTAMPVPDGLEETVFCTCQLPDGRPVFEYTDPEGQTTLFCFDGKKQKILYRGDNISALTRSADSKGRILSVSPDGALCWDAASGNCEILYKGDGWDFLECREVLRNSEGELVVLFHGKGTTYVYKLAETAADQRKVRIVQLYASKYVANCAAEYSRTHPGITVTVETPEEDMNIALAKIISDASDGGPDMFVLHRKQLKLLQEKEVLADLSGVLPDEEKSRIFAGALEYGTLNGKLYGVTYEAGISTLYMPKNLWGGDSWTWKDVVRLMEENPSVERYLPGSSLTADRMLYDLILIDIGSSGFVDFDRYECSFDTEEFIRLLKFCKERGESQNQGNYTSLTEEERLQEVLEGKALAYSVNGGIIDFSRTLAMFDDRFFCVGNPTFGESGSYLNCYQCLAVNAGTKNMDIVSDFVRYLMSEKCQRKYNAMQCVRRDVLLDCVKEHFDIGTGTEGVYFLIGSKQVIPLTGKKDGSSFLTEYLDLMDRAVPEGTENEIVDIISEEAAAYFSGDKDAETVADIIQRRVQLYLDERK